MRQIHPKTKARVGVGILAALAMVAIAPGAWFAQPAIAASATSDRPVAGDGSDASVGATVVLTARVYDEDGNLYAGAGTDTHVRFYFVSGSANDSEPARQQPGRRLLTRATTARAPSPSSRPASGTDTHLRAHRRRQRPVRRADVGAPELDDASTSSSTYDLLDRRST